MQKPARVDLWWMQGESEGGEGDRPIHCRALDLKSSLPPAWRIGERGRFVEMVLACYEKSNSARIEPSGRWRMNGAGRFHVSLSDAGAVYCVGIGLDAPIGIDAERIRPMADILTTLERLGFSALTAQIAPLGPAARQKAFFRIWTAFEAFLKLERLKWDDAAAKLKHLSARWRVAPDGFISFAESSRSGLVLSHLNIQSQLLVAVACPKPVEIIVRPLQLAS